MAWVFRADHPAVPCRLSPLQGHRPVTGVPRGADIVAPAFCAFGVQRVDILSANTSTQGCAHALGSSDSCRFRARRHCDVAGSPVFLVKHG